uniref:Putative rhodanese-related sulfurtransferase n=1 Tax=Magnetococcus massalia (strain MO-1) TaxID=451514 RepID=A0A1S7LN87_MAGMO|nr:Putative rhodanese-related sulfurtransferase [Candidatus Magnetococcus massalia]
MSWLEQNGLTLFFIFLAFLLIFKGPILARIFKIKNITVHELAEMLGQKSPPLLVDVRSTAEFNQDGRVAQAMLVPLGELSGRAGDIFKQNEHREVVAICRSGNRSTMGAVTLKRAGFATVYNVTGGMTNWQAQGYPVKK